MRIEEIMTFIPVTKKTISAIPNMAKALFNDNASQLKKPDIVPINLSFGFYHQRFPNFQILINIRGEP